MGYRVQLIAVTGKDPRTIQREFGVAPTGEKEEIAESPVVGAALPNGTYLLYVNDEDRIAPDSELFARLSKGASLIACCADETVMNSYVSAWSNGVEHWSVFHESQKGIKHLETSGKLPPEMRAIHDRLFAEQNEDDSADYVFDIPVALFAALGGIRYDDDIPGNDNDSEPWEILESRE